MSANKEGISQLSLPDIERRVANMIRYGKIDQVNLSTKRVKVKSGNIITGWLPWPSGSANSKRRRWSPPAVGEQVVMLAPTGDLRQATIITGLYQTDHAAPSSSGDEDLVEYTDGAVIGYNCSTHKLTANLGSDTSIIADRTSIKATRGNGSLEVTNAGITAGVGAIKIEVTTAGIKVTAGATVMEWTNAGTTLTTPSFSGVQS